MLWDRLKNISTIEFFSTSELSENNIRGQGKGHVMVSHDSSNKICFREKGIWTNYDGKNINFSNCYRWSQFKNNQTIGLEHLRYGKNNPVQLVELTQEKAFIWKSIKPHICNDDRYSLIVKENRCHLEMIWNIAGPKKDEIIVTTYY